LSLVTSSRLEKTLARAQEARKPGQAKEQKPSGESRKAEKP